jgi:hypothetical protein
MTEDASFAQQFPPRVSQPPIPWGPGATTTATATAASPIEDVADLLAYVST